MTNQTTETTPSRERIAVGAFTVNRIGYGTMQLAGAGVWGPPSNPDEAIAVLRRAVELGVEFIDTANSYGPYIVEELIREALHPYPERVKIATNAGLARTGPDEWTPVGHPAYLRQECEMSLRRLGVDRLDLFQLHRIDPTVAAEDQYGVLKDLRDQGKVAEVGLSSVSVEQIEAAQRIVPIATVQNLYNLGSRGSDDVIEHCEREGIVFIPWFPLAKGKLAQPDGPLNDVAEEVGATTAQVSLAWLLHRSPTMLPIPGTTSLAHLEHNCAAADVGLSTEQVQKLDDARRQLRRLALL
jgi:aryl-alcohol dehydrogenase-like predicted oxidoreductase